MMNNLKLYVVFFLSLFFYIIGCSESKESGSGVNASTDIVPSKDSLTVNNNNSSKDDSVQIHKDTLISKGITIGTFVEIQTGDYVHLVMKDSLGKIVSFFLSNEINDSLIEKLENDKSYTGKKIEVKWVKVREYIEEAGHEETFERAVEISILN